MEPERERVQGVGGALGCREVLRRRLPEGPEPVPRRVGRVRRDGDAHGRLEQRVHDGVVHRAHGVGAHLDAALNPLDELAGGRERLQARQVPEEHRHRRQRRGAAHHLPGVDVAPLAAREEVTGHVGQVAPGVREALAKVPGDGSGRPRPRASPVDLLGVEPHVVEDRGAGLGALDRLRPDVGGEVDLIAVGGIEEGEGVLGAVEQAMRERRVRAVFAGECALERAVAAVRVGAHGEALLEEFDERHVAPLHREGGPAGSPDEQEILAVEVGAQTPLRFLHGPVVGVLRAREFIEVSEVAPGVAGELGEVDGLALAVLEDHEPRGRAGSHRRKLLDARELDLRAFRIHRGEVAPVGLRNAAGALLVDDAELPAALAPVDLRELRRVEPRTALFDAPMDAAVHTPVGVRVEVEDGAQKAAVALDERPQIGAEIRCHNRLGASVHHDGAEPPRDVVLGVVVELARGVLVVPLRIVLVIARVDPEVVDRSRPLARAGHREAGEAQRDQNQAKVLPPHDAVEWSPKPVYVRFSSFASAECSAQATIEQLRAGGSPSPLCRRSPQG